MSEQIGREQNGVRVGRQAEEKIAKSREQTIAGDNSNA